MRGTATGRIRLARIPDASHVSLEGFITANIESASTLVTDGWPAYLAMADKGYTHKPVSIRAATETASELLPRVHRTASLLKRWLLGTHQAVEPEYLDFYLDEFTFRLNRRKSRSRGMLFNRLLEQAVRTEPPSPAASPAAPGPSRGHRPPTARTRNTTCSPLLYRSG